MELRFRDKINEELEVFFNEKGLEASSYSNKDIFEAIKEYTLRGGHRVRPSLVIYSFLCFKELDKEVIKASLCTELMQTYLLIHDDILDRDILRRGGLALHERYKRRYNDEHMGMSMGILAGDIASSFVYSCIERLKVKDKTKLYSLLNDILIKEGYGQVLDMISDFRNVNEEYVLNLYRLKTVPYTTVGPIKLGCVLGGAKKEELKLLEEYAIKIGVAYQLTDDIIGIYGNKEKTGKPDDSDIREGKKTLLIVKALKKSKNKEKILSLYGKQNIDDKSINEVREIIKQCGALEECSVYAKKLIDESMDMLNKMNIRDEGKNLLMDLTKFILVREK